MALLTKAPRGTQDFTPDVTPKLQYIEDTLLQTASLFGFGELRTPIFEHTDLFVRSVGDTTDVVQKEMYTFQDKKGRSITLKPEGTAGAVRAVLEHGLLSEALPQKLCYITPCFRYEKRQAGRYRQFHQFGVELLGAQSAAADAEVISLITQCLHNLGIDDLKLMLNSIGCPNCRPKYQQALVEYFNGHRDALCPTCLERLEKNPMRILDCKEEQCAKLAADAPVMVEYLCEECSAHFEELKSRLETMEIPFQLDPHIVRGLDYYTKTVFEFKSDAIGAQGTVCGGGRYDGLVEYLGGPKTPAVGFAIGLERLRIVMEAVGAPFPERETCDICLIPMGQEASIQCSRLAAQLRADGFRVESDLMQRSLKAQMKYANKCGAKYVMVLGDNELHNGYGQLKQMDTGEQVEVRLSELSDILAVRIADSLYQSIADSQLGADISLL